MVAQTVVSLVTVSVLVFTGCSKEDSKDEFSLPDESLAEADQDPVSEDVLEFGRRIQARGWREPSASQNQISDILKDYEHIDPRKVVPANLLRNALMYYHINLELIENKTVISVVDFSQHSRMARFFLINMNTGVVRSYHVSHGKGSDPRHSGYPVQFGNRPNSEMSSLGYYVASETYYGKHGYSMRLDGLSQSNSLARRRAIVVHGANYVRDVNARQGRSQGCLAFSMKNRKQIIDTVKGGSLMYVGRSSLYKSVQR